jgi:hypothetical protein
MLSVKVTPRRDVIMANVTAKAAPQKVKTVKREGFI